MMTANLGRIEQHPWGLGNHLVAEIAKTELLDFVEVDGIAVAHSKGFRHVEIGQVVAERMSTE